MDCSKIKKNIKEISIPKIKTSKNPYENLKGLGFKVNTAIIKAVIFNDKNEMTPNSHRTNLSFVSNS